MFKDRIDSEKGVPRRVQGAPQAGSYQCLHHNDMSILLSIVTPISPSCRFLAPVPMTLARFVQIEGKAIFRELSVFGQGLERFVQCQQCVSKVCVVMSLGTTSSRVPGLYLGSHFRFNRNMCLWVKILSAGILGSTEPMQFWSHKIVVLFSLVILS